MHHLTALHILKSILALFGSLVLMAYILLIAHLPLMYWFMDGGFTLGLWLALTTFVLFGGWWVIWRDTPILGWIWLGVFALIHVMLFLSPSVRGSYEQDTCLDIGGRWHNGECLTS